MFLYIDLIQTSQHNKVVLEPCFSVLQGVYFLYEACVFSFCLL